jgi:hypothetical protein
VVVLLLVLRAYLWNREQYRQLSYGDWPRAKTHI